MKELTEITDISHALNAIEIAIGFLSSTITPADEEQPYENYLRDNLKMDIVKCIPSRKVVQENQIYILSCMVKNDTNVECPDTSNGIGFNNVKITYVIVCVITSIKNEEITITDFLKVKQLK